MMQRLLATGLIASLVLTAGVGHADVEMTAQGAPALARNAGAGDESRAARDGRAVVAMMEGSARGLQDLLAKARRTQDARATACVSDSLSQANVLTRRAKDRYAMLREAVQRGDPAEQAHLLAQMKEDRALEREASKTAFACVGVMVVPRGRDLCVVKVTVDKSIPPELPSEHE